MGGDIYARGYGVVIMLGACLFLLSTSLVQLLLVYMVGRAAYFECGDFNTAPRLHCLYLRLDYLGLPNSLSFCSISYLQIKARQLAVRAH